MMRRTSAKREVMSAEVHSDELKARCLNSSLRTPHSSLLLPAIDAVEGDVDAAAFAVVVGEDEVAEEPERELAYVVFERERVARGRALRVDLARVYVVAEAVPDGRALHAKHAGPRAATYAQAVLVQRPLAEPTRG